MTENTVSTAPPAVADLFSDTKVDNRPIVGTTHAERVADAIAQLNNQDREIPLTFDPSEPDHRSTIIALLTSEERADQEIGIKRFTSVVKHSEANHLIQQINAITRPEVSEDTKSEVIAKLLSRTDAVHKWAVGAAHNLIDGTWDALPERDTTAKAKSSAPKPKPKSAAALGFKLPNLNNLDLNDLEIPSVTETDAEREAKEAEAIAEAEETATKVRGHVGYPAFLEFVEADQSLLWAVSNLENPRVLSRVKSARGAYYGWAFSPAGLLATRAHIKNHEWASAPWGDSREALGLDIEADAEEAFVQDLLGRLSGDTDESKNARDAMVRANAFAGTAIAKAVEAEERITSELMLVSKLLDQDWGREIPAWASECLEGAIDADRPVGPDVPWHERNSVRTAINFLFENFSKKAGRNPYSFLFADDYAGQMAAKSFLDEVIAFNAELREKSAAKRLGIAEEPVEAKTGRGKSQKAHDRGVAEAAQRASDPNRGRGLPKAEDFAKSGQQGKKK